MNCCPVDYFTNVYNAPNVLNRILSHLSNEDLNCLSFTSETAESVCLKALKIREENLVKRFCTMESENRLELYSKEKVPKFEKCFSVMNYREETSLHHFRRLL